VWTEVLHKIQVISIFIAHAMAQAVNRRPTAMMARVRSKSHNVFSLQIVDV